MEPEQRCRVYSKSIIYDGSWERSDLIRVGIPPKPLGLWIDQGGEPWSLMNLETSGLIRVGNPEAS